MRGASVDVDSDLPVGAGVSSSAALECAVALALCSLSGITVPRTVLAALAKRAENEFVGAPTGIIDQSAALLCQEGHAMLLDCETLETTQVPLRPAAAGVSILVIDTRVTHALVSGEYAARRAECEAAAQAARGAVAGAAGADGPGRGPHGTARRSRAPAPGAARGHRQRAGHGDRRGPQGHRRRTVRG